MAWNVNDRYKVDYYFCWGKSYAQKLINIANVPSDRVFIIGSPKLVSTPTNIEEKPSDAGNNVLLVSDYMLADFDRRKLSLWNKEYGLSVLYEEIEIIQKERRRAIETANELSQRGLSVTVRIHQEKVRYFIRKICYLAFNSRLVKCLSVTTWSRLIL